MITSEIAKIVAPNLMSVQYDLCWFHGRLASKCYLFTNENVGYASYSKLNDAKAYTFDDVREFFTKIGSEQCFREMLVVDSLCFNQDRHSGNYGVLFDNDTLEIVRMSPVFDLNLSMLPYAAMSEFENIGDVLFDYAPKLGNDFTRIGQIAMNDVILDRMKNIADLAFLSGEIIYSLKKGLSSWKKLSGNRQQQYFQMRYFKQRTYSFQRKQL